MQPGIQVLEAVTNLRGGGTRGVIYVEYLAPLLEGMERYFSQQLLGTPRGRRSRQPRRIITFARDQGPSGAGGGYDYLRGMGVPRVSQFHDGPDDDNRRVLSLAVETVASTASELLINRRPVESRIERVLNSSTALNNLAASSSIPGPSSSLHYHHHHPSTSSGSSGSSSSSSGSNTPTSQERMEDIQRRISFMANSNWSRTAGRASSSSTQTPSGGPSGNNGRPGPDEG